MSVFPLFSAWMPIDQVYLFLYRHSGMHTHRIYFIIGINFNLLILIPFQSYLIYKVSCLYNCMKLYGNI